MCEQLEEAKTRWVGGRRAREILREASDDPLPEPDPEPSDEDDDDPEPTPPIEISSRDEALATQFLEGVRMLLNLTTKTKR